VYVWIERGYVSRVLTQIENPKEGEGKELVPATHWIHDIKQRVVLHTQTVKTYIEKLVVSEKEAVVTPVGSFSQPDCTLM